MFLMFFIIIFLLCLLVVKICKKRLHENKLVRMDSILEHLRQCCISEENGANTLEIIGEIVKAPTYSLYSWDQIFNNYKLIAVRIQTEHIGEIRPSYSGLVPYKSGGYHPPHTLPFDPTWRSPVSWVNGDVPSMNLSFKGGQWLIRIGPIQCPHKSIVQKLERVIEVLNTVEMNSMK